AFTPERTSRRSAQRESTSGGGASTATRKAQAADNGTSVLRSFSAADSTKRSTLPEGTAAAPSAAASTVRAERVHSSTFKTMTKLAGTKSEAPWASASTRSTPVSAARRTTGGTSGRSSAQRPLSADNTSALAASSPPER